MRLHYILGGKSELTARLHSVVAVWLTAWIISGIGTRLHNRRTGLIAGVVWLTTLQVLVHGRLCVADMPLLLFLTLAARALLELLWLGTDKRWGLWFWVLYLSLGLGFLAKGPLALLVPALAVVLSRWIGRTPLPWARLQLFPGLAFTLLIVAAWGIPALVETHGLFWKVGMGEHVVKRGTEVLNGRAFLPLIYYPLTSVLSLFPWIGVAWPVWLYAKRHWDSGTIFLLGWLAAPYVIFSFYATQLPHYVMPAFPAAALLVARWLASIQHQDVFTPKFMQVLCSFWGLLGAGLVVFSQVLPPNAVSHIIIWLGVLLIILAIIGYFATRIIVYPRPMTGIMVMLLSFGLTVEQLGWTLRETNATLKVAVGTRYLPSTTAYLGWDYTEPSLVFYTGHPWEFTGKTEKVIQFLQQNPQALVTALEREWTLGGWFKAKFAGTPPETPTRDQSEKVMAVQKRFPQLQSRFAQGINIARMSWVEVRVMEQRPESVNADLR